MNSWIEIRNSAGHLLFRYTPFTNEIEFKKGGWSYDIIRLDEIRVKYEVITPPESERTEIHIASGKRVNGA